MKYDYYTLCFMTPQLLFIDDLVLRCHLRYHISVSSCVSKLYAVLKVSQSLLMS